MGAFTPPPMEVLLTRLASELEGGRLPWLQGVQAVDGPVAMLALKLVEGEPVYLVQRDAGWLLSAGLMVDDPEEEHPGLWYEVLLHQALEWLPASLVRVGNVLTLAVGLPPEVGFEELCEAVQGLAQMATKARAELPV